MNKKDIIFVEKKLIFLLINYNKFIKKFMDIKRIYNFTKNKLFPLNRLNRKGTETHTSINSKNIAKIQIKRLKSGTRVFDWEIPDEWNVKEAYIEDRFGKKLSTLKIITYIWLDIKASKFDFKKKELLKNLLFQSKTSFSDPLYYLVLQKKDGDFV